MAKERISEMKDAITAMLPDQPVSQFQQVPGNSISGKTLSYNNRKAGSASGKESPDFVQNLTSLFGYKRKAVGKNMGSRNIEFLKVDANSEMKIAQAKLAKTFNTKMSGKLDELFDAWLHDTTDTYTVMLDRQKRLTELEFAISADPFLGRAANMYADEATQVDVQGKLIQIECADIRMKEKMEDLLLQWGVTQNRLRALAYNLSAYGDAFWSVKVTPRGVIRINPVTVRQVKERLEFNPIQVQNDIALRKGWVSAINRSQKLQALFDTIDDTDNEEFADIFDTRLFGFVLDDEMVVPPWSIAHFRLNADQSEYFPMGRSLFLQALAPFRQCSATMVLQSLARVQSFPVTVYSVKTAQGMDEALQFEKINQVREEYELIGDSGAGSEALSVNTKIWAPEGLLTLDMHSPDIDINATNDIEMHQDRVAIASGIPKGYLIQEWGGFGNSAISLVEQFKPFARTVFTIQSSILDGLTNLFRLHFAITGDYDYREDFILSLKFPNEESSDARQSARQNSLNLSKDVLQTIAQVVGAINDPLPPEIIRDILTKFSFLDPEDIKKWVKKNPNQVEKSEDEMEPEEMGGDLGGGGMMGGGGDLGGMGGDLGSENMDTAPDLGTLGGGEESGMMPGPEEGGMPTSEPTTNESTFLSYENVEQELFRERRERRERVLKRYTEAKDLINEKVIKEFKKIQETQHNQRHYKFSRVEECYLPMYELLSPSSKRKSPAASALRESGEVFNEMKAEVIEKKLNWGKILEQIEDFDEETDEITDDDEDYPEEDRLDDEERQKNLSSILS